MDRKSFLKTAAGAGIATILPAPEILAQPLVKPMTVADWREISPVIQWRIFNESWESKKAKPYDEWILNLNAPVPDGRYKGKWHNHGDRGTRYVGIDSICVENGQFVVEPMVSQIHQVMCALEGKPKGSPVHSCCIERVEWSLPLDAPAEELEAGWKNGFFALGFGS